MHTDGILSDDEEITAYVKALERLTRVAIGFAERCTEADPPIRLTYQAEEAIRSSIARAYNAIDRASNPSSALSTLEVGFGIRARRACRRLGVTTMAQLSRKTPDEIKAIKNVGMTTVDEIRKKLKKCGLSLKDDNKELI